MSPEAKRVCCGLSFSPAPVGGFPADLPSPGSHSLCFRCFAHTRAGELVNQRHLYAGMTRRRDEHPSRSKPLPLAFPCTRSPCLPGATALSRDPRRQHRQPCGVPLPRARQPPIPLSRLTGSASHRVCTERQTQRRIARLRFRPGRRTRTSREGRRSDGRAPLPLPVH